MAHQATHIRFALDLEPHLNIQDRKAYLAGAVYPDTRYPTNTPREKTHRKPHAPQSPFEDGLSDFEKGWGTHVLYDQQSFPFWEINATMKTRGEDGWYNPDFVPEMTAMKTIEDIHTYQFLSDEALRFLTSFSYPVLPNNESLEGIKVFVQAVSQLYRQKPGIEDYLTYSRSIANSSDQFCESHKNKVLEIQTNTKLKEKIESVYNQVLLFVEENYL